MMHTHSGKAFDLNALTVHMISIEDIAHALSQLCRYNGHTRFHYSVAQHSVYVARAVETALVLPALLHDAAEAYIGDVTHDLKHSDEMKGFRTIEWRVERVIARTFGIEAAQLSDPAVKIADRRMAVTEKRDLFDYKIEWSHPEYQVEPYPIEIEEWTPRYAEHRFLELYKELTSL